MFGVMMNPVTSIIPPLIMALALSETIHIFSHMDLRVLDAFPRQMPRVDEDAAPLVDALWTELAQSVVIPDGHGAPRPASDLSRHPTKSADIARQWEEIANVDARAQLVHSTCLVGQRPSRFDALAEHLPGATAESTLPNIPLLVSPLTATTVTVAS